MNRREGSEWIDNRNPHEPSTQSKWHSVTQGQLQQQQRQRQQQQRRGQQLRWGAGRNIGSKERERENKVRRMDAVALDGILHSHCTVIALGKSYRRPCRAGKSSKVRSEAFISNVSVNLCYPSYFTWQVLALRVSMLKRHPLALSYFHLSKTTTSSCKWYESALGTLFFSLEWQAIRTQLTCFILRPSLSLSLSTLPSDTEKRKKKVQEKEKEKKEQKKTESHGQICIFFANFLSSFRAVDGCLLQMTMQECEKEHSPPPKMDPERAGKQRESRKNHQREAKRIHEGRKKKKEKRTIKRQRWFGCCEWKWQLGYGWFFLVHQMMRMRILTCMMSQVRSYPASSHPKWGSCWFKWTSSSSSAAGDAASASVFH